MEIKGKIKMIGEIKSLGDKGFRKREVVVTTDGDYPQDILIEFIQDNCELLSNFSEGQSVEIGINIKGREWIDQKGEVKYFNSIQGWRIVLDKSSGITKKNKSDENKEDDLPF